MSRIDIPVSSPLDAVCDALCRWDRLKEAESLLDTFQSEWPKNHPEALDELARNYYRCKSYTKSIDQLERALSFATDNQVRYGIRGNLAKMYNHVNRPERSAEMSRLNLLTNPSNPDTLMELQFSEYLMGNLEKSEEMLKSILEIPGIPTELRDRVLFNLGTYDLYHGEFQKGLRGFILGGKKIGIWPNSVAHHRQWDGEMTQEAVHIIEEGGIGDSIINVRFAPMATARGLNVVWVTLREDLKTVYNRNGIRTITMDEFKTIKDPLVAGAMDMPILLNVDEKTLWSGPYLKPDADRFEKWKKILGEGECVGAKWSGNPLYEQDLHRSISAEQIHKAVLQSHPDAPFINLQLEVNRADGREFGFIEPDIEDWEDTLAILSLLKFTVTSCTSIAHAAGAIGARVFVMVPRAAYYTWCWLPEKSPHSIWYGENLMWFQKENHDTWDSAFEDLQKWLESV